MILPSNRAIGVFSRCCLAANLPYVIASGAKQSSAREARQLKSAAVAATSASFFARLPARGWIASLRSQ
jgi:hypothetical protein